MSKMRPPVASGHEKIPEFLVHSKVSNCVTLGTHRACFLKTAKMPITLPDG